MNQDHYAILDISRSASLKDIKEAYRRLAFQHHPDRNPDKAQAEATIKEINAAYDILRNPEKRRKYDSQFAAKPQPAYRPVYEDEPYRESRSTSATYGMHRTDLSDFVESLHQWAYDLQYGIPSRYANFLLMAMTLFFINHVYSNLFYTIFQENAGHNARLETLFSFMRFIFLYYWLYFEAAWHWLFFGIVLGIGIIALTGRFALAGWLLVAAQTVLCVALLFFPSLFAGFVLFYQPLFTIEPLKPQP